MWFFSQNSHNYLKYLKKDAKLIWLKMMNYGLFIINTTEYILY